jgi:AcrR family transcriptional regulator
VAAILEAAAQLIAEDGYAAASTNRIAGRAGVSIGSLYQYFPNKEAILIGLIEQHQRAIQPVIERSLVQLRDPSVPLASAMRELFQRLVAAHADSPRLNRALTEEVPHPPDLRRRERERDQAYVERLAEILARRPEARIRDPLVAAQVLVQATTALARWISHDAPEHVGRDVLIDEAAGMLTAYVLRG